MTNKNYNTTAISIGELKNGMLYFDNIIPVCIWIEFIKEMGKETWGSTFQKVYEDIMPKEYVGNQKFGQAIFNLNETGYKSISKILVENFKLDKNILKVSNEQYEQLENIYAQEYFSFINEFDLGHLPLIAVNNTKSALLLDDETDSYANPLLTISNLKLIDATNSNWEQLLEFRKDKDAKIKLRKLRLFAYENYSGKSKNFIEDDIQSKIYDYELTAKKFGLNLIQAALSNVMNSKLFAGLTTGSILTTVFADFPAGILTTSAGIVANLGHLTLEYNKQKIELQNLVKENPASFITYYKDKYEKEE